MGGLMGRLIKILFILLFMHSSVAANAQDFTKGLKDKIVKYRVEREIIRKELISRVRNKALKTRAEKRQAITKWKIENSGRIAKQKRLAVEIRKKLRDKIIEKVETIQKLPKEEGAHLLQNWYAQNSRYFSVVGGPKSLEMAMNELKVKAPKQFSEQTPQAADSQVKTPDSNKDVAVKGKKVKKPKKNKAKAEKKIKKKKIKKKKIKKKKIKKKKIKKKKDKDKKKKKNKKDKDKKKKKNKKDKDKKKKKNKKKKSKK
jgi:hypothetical protein